MNDRPLSYSRPADVLEMLFLLGFLSIGEARGKYRAACGSAAEFEAFVARYRAELEDD